MGVLETKVSYQTSVAPKKMEINISDLLTAARHPQKKKKKARRDLFSEPEQKQDMPLTPHADCVRDAENGLAGWKS